MLSVFKFNKECLRVRTEAKTNWEVTAVNQVGDDGDLGQASSSRGGERLSDSGYILKT